MRCFQFIVLFRKSKLQKDNFIFTKLANCVVLIINLNLILRMKVLHFCLFLYLFLKWIVFPKSMTNPILTRLLYPGPKLHPDFTDCFYYSQPQIMESDVDLLDSATSSNKGLTISEMVKNLPNHISMMLLNSNLTDIGLTGHKLSHAKEIILNTELLFQNASLDNFLIGPFLLDQLEILVSTLWKTSNWFLGFEEKTKEGNQLRIFLFDCLIECLERKYGRYCKTGLKAWSRIPVGAYREVLISEVDEEVRKWVEMAGKIQDEIIEWEMSHSLGKWTDFEIEAYESGAEIDGGILYNLVDEIVADLLDNVVGSS